MSSTVAGAAVNIIINLFLISYFGLYSAVFSTFISYFIIFILRVKYVQEKVNIKIDMRNLFVSVTLLVFLAVLSIFSKTKISIIVYIALLICNYKELKKIFIYLKSYLRM